MLFVTKHLPHSLYSLRALWGGKKVPWEDTWCCVVGSKYFHGCFFALKNIIKQRYEQRVGVLSFYLLPVFSLISSDSSLSLFFAHSLGLFLLFSISLSQSISHLLPAQPEATRWEGIVAYFSSLPWNTFISSGIFQPLSRFLTYVSIAICAWQWWLWHETDGMMGPSVHGTGAATLSWTETTHKHTHTHPGEYNFPFYMLLYFVILFSKWLLSTNWISLHKHFANCS